MKSYQFEEDGYIAVTVERIRDNEENKRLTRFFTPIEANSGLVKDKRIVDHIYENMIERLARGEMKKTFRVIKGGKDNENI